MTQAHSAAQSTAPAYKDPKLPVEARVEDLLARMTLEEKVAQMLSIWENKADVFDARMEFDPAKMALKYPNGIGTFARPSDATGPSSPRVVRRRDIPGTIRLVNALQHYAMTGTRLGIPILLHEEGLHGYAAVGATSFPQAIALASSWDPALVRAVNAVTAREGFLDRPFHGTRIYLSSGPRISSSSTATMNSSRARCASTYCRRRECIRGTPPSAAASRTETCAADPPRPQGTRCALRQARRRAPHAQQACCPVLSHPGEDDADGSVAQGVGR
jgi:hypothetical protein